MHLYLIRHADAFPLGIDGIDNDEDRPLTDKGRHQCQIVALALRQVGVKLEKVLTSPLVRARQTAEELLMHWNDPTIEQVNCEYLAPGGKKRKLLRDILSGGEAIALVGHNPDLSELAGWFLGEKEGGFEMAKAGVACIAFDGPPNKGTGVLKWLVTPAWCELVAGGERHSAKASAG